MNIAVLSVHTTGLDPVTDEVVEVAIVSPGETVEQAFVRRFYARGPVPTNVRKHNGYDPETYGFPFYAADAEVIAAELVKRGAILTYWDAAIPFLQNAFRQVRVPWPSRMQLRPHVYDLQSLALPLVTCGAIKTTTLTELCAFFELGEVKHSALSDAMQAAKVFELLVEGYTKELGL